MTIAEKPATIEKVAADPNIGAYARRVSLAELNAKYAVQS
jgi:hypothetical protein